MRVRALPRWFLWVMIVVPPGMWIVMLVYSQVDEQGFMQWTQEDGWVENLQALFSFVVACLSGMIAWKFRAQRKTFWSVCYAVLALGFLWVGIEELRSRYIPEIYQVIDSVFAHVVYLTVWISIIGWGFKRPLQRLWGKLEAFFWIPHPVLLPTWISVLSYEWLRVWYHKHYQAVTVSPLVNRLHEGREVIFMLGVLGFLFIVLRQVRSIDKGKPKLNA
jgi:hypothetical protein